MCVCVWERESRERQRGDLIHGGSGSGARIRAITRLAEAEAAQLFARGVGRQELLLLLVRAELFYRAAVKAVVHAHDDLMHVCRG